MIPLVAGDMAALIPVKSGHCQTVASNMWDLRTEDRFCDIILKVDGKTFLCHRHVLSAACEYFRAMFTGRFEESCSTEVTLHGIDSNTFETVLRFMYTGDVVISTSNALSLIHAAAFYGLERLGVRLVQFAHDTYQTLSSEDILKMYTTAQTQGLSSLIGLLGEYIYIDFGFFSDNPEFINMTWDSLMALSNLVPHVHGLQLTDTFAEGVLKWIRSQEDASPCERRSYLEKFVQILLRRKSHSKCIQRMIYRYRNVEQAPVSKAAAVHGERPPQLPRVFVAKPAADGPGLKDVRVFTLHETNDGLDWAYSGVLLHVGKNMRNVVFDDSFYTLVPGESGASSVSFVRFPRAFTGAPHISVSKHQELQPPPGITDHFELCGMNNNIFAYNKTALLQVGPNSNSNVTDSYQGLMHYKRDIDKWFSTPPQEYTMSCITCDERMVYLIGGKSSNGEAQVYDLRTPAWLNLPRTAGLYEDASCCVCDEKIWVVGGKKKTTSVEIFDPIAAKWRSGKDLIEGRPGRSQLVNWDSALYGRQVVSFCNSSYSHHGILLSDDRSFSGWNIIPGLPLITETSGHYLAGMVVF